jgi:sec-independent protein translocase protein TatA
MFGIGTPELIVILVIALIIFGPKNLPKIGRSLGKSLREFKKATNDLTSAMEEDLTGPPRNITPKVQQEIEEEEEQEQNSEKEEKTDPDNARPASPQ